MTRRIEKRAYRLGSGNNAEPEKIQELQDRQEKHERLTRGKPDKAFSAVLKDRMKKLRGDEDEAEDEEQEEKGAKEPLLALHPGQKSSIANKSGGRAGKVIVKG